MPNRRLASLLAIAFLTPLPLFAWPFGYGPEQPLTSEAWTAVGGQSACPVVVAGNGGGYAVAWLRGGDVVVRTVDASGALGAERVLETAVTPDLLSGAAVSGGYSFSWRAASSSAAPRSYRAQQLSSSGTPGAKLRPKVSGSTRFVPHAGGYFNFVAPASEKVSVQLLSPAGRLLKTVRWSTGRVHGTLQPAVASDGSFAVLWTTDGVTGVELWARTFDRAGKARAAIDLGVLDPLEITTAALGPSGLFAVLQLRNPDTIASVRTFDVQGTPLGEHEVRSDLSGPPNSISIDADDHVMPVWQSFLWNLDKAFFEVHARDASVRSSFGLTLGSDQDHGYITRCATVTPANGRWVMVREGDDEVSLQRYVLYQDVTWLSDPTGSR